MVTVPRALGLRAVIFTNHHRPAHVHVSGNGKANINLSGPDGAPELVCAGKMTRSDVRRAMGPVTERQVALANGCTFTFSPRLAQGLGGATECQPAQIEVLGSGTGLYWEMLVVDLSVPDRLAGLFGTKTYMAHRAGQARSRAKAVAVRANGAKGGRPRKSAGYVLAIVYQGSAGSLPLKRMDTTILLC